MNEWLQSWQKKLQLVFHEYGKVIFVFFFLSLCLISIYLIIYLISPHTLRVSFLDVGQGDAILIQTPSGKRMLIDGGATTIILSRLASEMSYFNNRVDVLVATHPDTDHVTGLIPVLEKYNVKTIIVSPAISDTNIFGDVKKHIDDERADIYTARTGDRIDFHDGVVAQILYPPLQSVRKMNDTNSVSVSMLITYGNETFLLTGDLPSTEEQQLINSGFLDFIKNITVYKVGHHGSKYSSGEQLLSYIKPEYSVVSAGKNNKYGHPNGETIERLQKYTKEIISTIDRGTISFVTDGRMMEVETGK